MPLARTRLRPRRNLRIRASRALLRLPALMRWRVRNPVVRDWSPTSGSKAEPETRRLEERTSLGHLLRLGLVLPLSVGQTPAASKGLVEAHMAEEPVTPNLREHALGRVELLLRLEHLEVVGQPLTIAIRRAVDGVPKRLHRPVLPGLGVAQLGERGERVRDFPQRVEHRPFVLKLCLLPLSDGRSVGPEGAARVE